MVIHSQGIGFLMGSDEIQKFKITLPIDAWPLALENVRERLKFYYLRYDDPTGNEKEMEFVMVPTGKEFKAKEIDGKYWGVKQFDGGLYILHVWSRWVRE